MTSSCLRTAVKDELRDLLCKPFGDAIPQAVYYEPNLISILETYLTWIGKGKLIGCETESYQRLFSVRQLHGLWAGKPEYESSYPDLLAYSKKLLPASEYPSASRIGYETDQDFERNCQYIEQHKRRITGSDDGEFHVIHRTWDNRNFLFNNDGAHHFAAVYRQCMEQDRDFTFEAYLEHHFLNKATCRSLIDNAYILLCSTRYAGSLSKLLVRYGHHLPPIQCEYDTEKSLLDINRNLPKAEMIYHSIVDTLPHNVYFDLTLWMNTVLESQ